MRIMIFNTLYYPYKVGGAEVSVKLLAERLVELGNDVRVVSLTKEPQKHESIINGVSCVYIPMPNIYWPFDSEKSPIWKKILWHVFDSFNFLSYFYAKKEILKFNPDIVHTNNLAGWSISVWSAAKKTGKKIVHTSRDYYLMHQNSTLFSNGKIVDENKFIIRLLSIHKRFFSRNVDHYVGISNFIRNIHLNSGFFPNAKTSCIYNAVPKISLTSTTDSTTKKRVGFIGRLSAEKGFDIFCEIADKNKHTYEFMAAGKFDNKNKVLNLQKKAEGSNVKLLGFIDLRDFLNNVDIVFLPIKWNEPFGRVVVECALAGKMVLTSGVGGISELNDILPNVFLSNNWERDFNVIVDNNDIRLPDSHACEIFSEKKIAEEYFKVFVELKCVY